MAFAFVQTAQNSSAGATSIVVTLAQPAQAGSLLIIAGKWAPGSSGVSVTDNASSPNTYASAGAINSTGNTFAGRMYYGVQVTSGATTVTVSWTGSVAARIQVDEYSGVDPTSNAAAFDVSTTNTGTGTSGSGTLSPSLAGELIIAAYALGSSLTITAGTNYVANTNGTTVATEYRLSGTTSETAPATFSSTTWTVVAAAFKPAAQSNPGAFFAMF